MCKNVAKDQLTNDIFKLKQKHTIRTTAKSKNKQTDKNELLLHLFSRNERRKTKKKCTHTQNDENIVCHSCSHDSNAVGNIFAIFSYSCCFHFYGQQYLFSTVWFPLVQLPSTVFDRNKINNHRMNDTHLTWTTVVDNSFDMELVTGNYFSFFFLSFSLFRTNTFEFKQLENEILIQLKSFWMTKFRWTKRPWEYMCDKCLFVGLIFIFCIKFVLFSYSEFIHVAVDLKKIAFDVLQTSYFMCSTSDIL